MTAIESLHYAVGELAYAVASADGTIQKEEREKFHRIVNEELQSKEYDFDISEIIFQVMEMDKISTENAYNWAIKQIKQNSHYLSPQLKEKFVIVMEKVAKAYLPVTNDEKALINRFKKDIATINGDPIYYNAHKKMQSK